MYIRIAEGKDNWHIDVVSEVDGSCISLDQLMGLIPEVIIPEDMDRDEKILKLFGKGYTRQEITSQVDCSYQVVCAVIRKRLDEKS